MGSGQSTRKLTISNEEEIGVIKVSNAVVERLAQGSNKVPTDTIKDVSSFTPTQSANPTVPLSSSQTGNVPSGYPVYYYPELTLSALEIQNRKEQELQVQNQYWQRRLQDMEKKHLLIDRILEEEYKKTIDEFSSGKVIGQKMEDNLSDEQLCTAGKEKIIKCYQENPKEILNCSDLVEEFSNCVDQRRVNLITTRC
ncbi:uncharacterized protein LOC122636243 isoform X1 [Vespula pensylvanica]|uniref:MICOS complex subunit MIC19 n=1 Tax=Vespula pensylvanica TaxID=30213 RepID=A0A834UH78_VESPE|nr:uncharacterized protein LOC122636243 isoform X1 [Vespula pensylvanica]XP_043683197.1 uncharacterized protein LOC122636243 isoform X1 [Vespula pensylvanica]XP_043683207.1 uncharacterized protein LOC122636243 isoform X1 [Vespula pensylvanica]KAF7439009.1 hypothetical protein H0235_001400 [Vespula pensylvanica]